MSLISASFTSNPLTLPAAVEGANAELATSDAAGIIHWALSHARNPVVTTNFKPRSAVLLHLLTRVYPDLPVIWIDTGYNTAATYRYAEALRAELDLNLLVYSPRVTVARRSALGGVPRPHNRQFERFARESKLEPFERAFNELKPDVWFTGIRREQTALRATLGVVSRGAHNSLRVAPLYAWDDTQLTRYLVHHGLADNDDYVDPTKPGAHLECGLHTLA